MSAFLRLAAAPGVLGLTMLLAAGNIGAAQPKPAAPVTAHPEAAQDMPSIEQVALTEKQIEGLLAAQKDISAATSKAEDNDKPDPKMQATLDGIAKKYGFANYAEYDKVAANVGLVMGGFDPQTKKYIGPEAVIKKQIADIKVDKEIPPLDKKKALGELEGSLKTVTPLQFPDNIALVTKHYDKLSEALQED
jgi:hypothetical protein